MKITGNSFRKIQRLLNFAKAHYTSLSPRKKSTVSVITSFLVLIFVSVLFKGCISLLCNHTKPAIQPMVIREGNVLKVPEGSPLRKQLIAQNVEISSAPHLISIPGSIEADPLLTVNVLSPLPGRLTSIDVNLGDTVKKDQLLAEISSPDLQQAQSYFKIAQAVLVQTQAALKRSKEVNRVGGNSIKDIEIALSNFEQAEAEFKRAETTLNILGHNTSNSLTIKAPISGKITAINYGKFAYITDPTSTLLTITNIQSILVTANIPENLIGKTIKNMPVEIKVNAYPSDVWHGKVTFVNAYLDSDSRRNKTRISLQNSNEKLQPNMFATIQISYPLPNHIIIPVSSVLMNNDTTSVFVEIAPWTFERRDVELGAEDGEKVRVLAGIKSNDRVVVSGGVLVND